MIKSFLLKICWPNISPELLERSISRCIYLLELTKKQINPRNKKISAKGENAEIPKGQVLLLTITAVGRYENMRVNRIERTEEKYF